MSDSHDLEIVEKAISGDVDAFSVIVKKYENRIFRYVYSQVNNYDESLDVTQEIFVMTFMALKSFRREAKFSTWLFSIMVNHCKNFRKKRDRLHLVPIHNRINGEDEYELQLADERENPERELLDREAMKTVKEELYALPEDYREILVLRDIEGLAYGEIARILGIHLSNVKVRIHRGRELLKKRLQARGFL